MAAQTQMASLGLALYMLLLTQSALLVLAHVKRVESPCSACTAVARELQRRIDNEPVRNHVDLRHRLDKTGARYGKIIEYKNSELRAVELLDGFCQIMKDYALVDANNTETGELTKKWAKVKGPHMDNLANMVRPRREEEDNHGKRLETYCGSVIEEFEEEVYAGIMKGGFDTDGVEDVLCRNIITPCPPRALVETPDAAAAADSQADAAANKAEGYDAPKEEL